MSAESGTDIRPNIVRATQDLLERVDGVDFFADLTSPEVERAQRARRKFGASGGKKFRACLTMSGANLKLLIRSGTPDENVRDAECEWPRFRFK